MKQEIIKILDDMIDEIENHTEEGIPDFVRRAVRFEQRQHIFNRNYEKIRFYSLLNLLKMLQKTDNSKCVKHSSYVDRLNDLLEIDLKINMKKTIKSLVNPPKPANTQKKQILALMGLSAEEIQKMTGFKLNYIKSVLQNAIKEELIWTE